MNAEKISLYYKDGGSDKVYHAQLEGPGPGDTFVVNFQYGRRGSTLSSGTKTAVPVSYDKAKKVYDKLVAEKKGKGYTEGEDGTPYQGSEKAGQVSGLVPQLLNAIEAPELYINDPAFMAQQKMDGIRLMVQVTDTQIVGSNRKGFIVPISAEIVAGLKQFLIDGEENLVLDGEAIGDVYYVFDILERGNDDLRGVPAIERYETLVDVFKGVDSDQAIELVMTEYTTEGKQMLFEQLKAQKAEGIVFKKKASAYVPGRPNSGGNQVKFKFTQTCTCQVAGVNGNKRSVALVMRDDVKSTVSVGNVTIPSNFEIPKPGTLVEIRYLYAYPGGSLFQPVYLGERIDLDWPDAVNTLKFKQGTTDEEEG